MPHFRVALSFPEERSELVKAVAAELEKVLGPGGVFIYYDYLPAMARPNLAAALQQIYHDHSRLVVAFLDDRYGVKRWCGIEWRAIQDRFLSEQSDQVMLLRLTERINVKGIYTTDGLFDARGLSASAIAQAVLQRLEWMEAAEGPVPEPSDHPPGPGLLRRFLDRVAPGVHRALTRRDARFFPEPAELAAIDDWLGKLSGRLKNSLWAKTYLPLQARNVPEDSEDSELQDPFVRFVHLNVRRILGSEEGGDSASPEIAAVNRRTRLIRDIVRTLLGSREPLVLLGDPGSGKTLTLQSALLTLIRSQRRRVFPIVPLYIRLGEFHVNEGEIGPEAVRRLVESSCPPSLRRWLAELGRAGRLVLVFDGMDEMSRDRYIEHTQALNLFTSDDPRGARSLFTCRITDFSPELKHQRLVLLPFDRAQIVRYLRLHVPTSNVQIDGERLTLFQLARRLAAGGLSVDARNPFVLSLLCGFIRRNRMWPVSNVELLRDFLEETYERKKLETEEDEEGVALPLQDELFQAWARFAWIITEHNLGTDTPAETLLAGMDEPAEQVRTMILAGKHCGVLAESVQEKEHLIRFEHHRFQEYFAALWIHENRPEIDWLTRLDAPRWQQTMLNLVLLGGAEKGIEALTASIASVTPAQGWADLPYEQEALLADRVELGARLLWQSGQSSPAVQDHLRPGLRKAIESLVEGGKPITQVKMMRACQNLTDLDLLEVLSRPLRSSVSWVRDQALILLASSRPSQQGSANLVAEMGLDLAKSTFLTRWPTYLKAVAPSSRKHPLWAPFLLATLCGTAELVLLLATAWGLFELALMGLGAMPGEARAAVSQLVLFAPGKHRAFQAVVTLAATAVGLWSRPARLWAWSLGSVPVGLLLNVVASSLWQGSWFDIMGDFYKVTIICWAVPAIPVFVLGLLIHFSPLLVYALAGWPRQGFRSRSRSLMRLAWQECGFGPALKRISKWGAIGGGLILLAFKGEEIFRALDDRWTRVTGRPFEMQKLETFLLGLALIYLFAPLALALIARMYALFRKRDSAWVGAIGKWLGSSFGTHAGWTKILRWTGSALLKVSGCLVLLILFFAAAIFSTVSGRIAILTCMLLVTALVWRKMAAWRRSHRVFPPGSWEPEAWVKELDAAMVQDQDILLRRTTHQSVSLTSEGFLQLLASAETSVKEEPALSTYWDRRDQLEQALRQERQG